MSLTLHTNHIQAMKAHAESTYPEECCGLMLGRVEQDDRILIELHPVQNSWDHEIADDLQDTSSFTQTRRYAIAPEEMLKVMQDARHRRLDIIGIYHSHPDHSAVPSDCDRRLAWQHYSYSIISVQQGKAREFYSWRLDADHQFQPEALTILPTTLDSVCPH